MTVRVVGPECSNGKECNPRYPARPVYRDGKCWFCWTSGRVPFAPVIALKEVVASARDLAA